MHAQKLVDKAKDASDRNAHDLAIELYLQAMALEPDHREAREGIRTVELKKFEGYYPSKLTRSIGSIGARLAGIFARITKNHERKMTACERILQGDPKNAAVGLKLGEAAVAAGYKNAAAAAYGGVLLSHPDSEEALKGLGRMLAQLGEPKAALEAFERALSINPRDQEASRMRNNLAAEVSITATGIDVAGHSRDVLKDREKTKNLEESGRVVRSADDLTSLISTLEKKLEENPDDARLHAELATRHLARHDREKAIASYDRAYQLEPTNALFREKAGDIRRAVHEDRLGAAKEDGDEEAIERVGAELRDFLVEDYSARVAAHPTELALHFQLGKALYANGDLDRAIAEFQQTVKDPRRKIESLVSLGNCFLDKGLVEPAKRQFEHALNETPGMSDRKKDILFSLGHLYEKQDQPEKALEEYMRIYEVDIHFRDVSRRIEKLNEKLAD